MININNPPIIPGIWAKDKKLKRESKNGLLIVYIKRFISRSKIIETKPNIRKDANDNNKILPLFMAKKARTYLNNFGIYKS